MEDDKTTTGSEAVETGADEALPDEQQKQTAAGTADQDQGEQQTSTEASNEADDKLKKYAESHGLELDSPNAIKAAKIAMDNQAEYQRSKQKTSELEKSMNGVSDQIAEQTAQQTGQDPALLARLQRMEVKSMVSDFWSKDGVDRKYEPVMVDILKNKPHLAGDLDALYALAVTSNSDTIKSEGGREALQALANKQQIVAPKGSAVSSNVEKQEDDPFLKGLNSK